MKLNIFVALGLLAVFKDAAKALVIAKPNDAVRSKSDSNCTQDSSTEECLIEEGRKRKKGGQGGGNNGDNVVVIDNNGQAPHGTIGGFGVEEYFIEEDDDDDDGGGHHKRGKGKKGRKKNKKKGGKKIYKKMGPIMMGLGGMKLLLHHLLLKKVALLSIISFLLGKVSFILASLVALKQFFHTPSQHRSTEQNKLEVVHIPIRKLRQNKHKEEKDSYFDESKFVPVTFAPETEYDTTPFFYDFPYRENNPDSFINSEETFNGNFDGKFSQSFDENGTGSFNDENFNEIYNEHFDKRFKDGFSKADDRTDQKSQKTFYKNHVHSPFV